MAGKNIDLGRCISLPAHATSSLEALFTRSTSWRATPNRECIEADNMIPTSTEQKHLFDVARAALTHWGCSDQSELSLLKYRENAVFAVTSPDGSKAALRLHRPNYHSRRALISELQWMLALHTSGIPVTRAVPTSTGELLVSVDRTDDGEAFWVDMLEWIDGAPVGSAEARTYAGPESIERIYVQLGKLAAQIHLQSSSWTAPDDFWRPSWDIAGCIGEPDSRHGVDINEPLWGRYDDLENLSATQRDLLVRASRVATDAMRVFGFARDRYGLVHADLVPDNLMETPSGLIVIDFDDCGYGWFLWDLVTAVFWHLGEPTYDSALRGYVAGYRSVGQLPDDHLSLIPSMLLLRALVYLGWMHTRKDTETARELTSHVIAISEQLARDVLSNKNNPTSDSPIATRLFA
ncbi:MAG TPA: phosphotransferase [Paraburkholderia sp.]|uniref:phosphotransferase enzyme family protein n=1 Tax=Paraburkholderia sp. TaxID=1926495 RepID=UPI002B47E7FE|nr:phosphotransferase [Paraburkholderia sp.]HKR40432.1 phosphotransferase [Paraburkholderia sp.]